MGKTSNSNLKPQSGPISNTGPYSDSIPKKSRQFGALRVIDEELEQLVNRICLRMTQVYYAEPTR